MTTVDCIVRAAIPDADGALVSHIVWGRTCYPCGPVSARDLYRAASAWKRASVKGIQLCDFCHRIAAPGATTCETCFSALERIAASLR